MFNNIHGYRSVLPFSVTCQFYHLVLSFSVTSHCYLSMLLLTVTSQCYSSLLPLSVTPQCSVDYVTYSYSDLRPHNILLSSQGQITLTYFCRWPGVHQELSSKSKENFHVAPGRWCSLNTASICMCSWFEVENTLMIVFTVVLVNNN